MSRVGFVSFDGWAGLREEMNLEEKNASYSSTLILHFLCGYVCRYVFLLGEICGNFSCNACMLTSTQVFEK